MIASLDKKHRETQNFTGHADGQHSRRAVTITALCASICGLRALLLASPDRSLTFLLDSAYVDQGAAESRASCVDGFQPQRSAPRSTGMRISAMRHGRASEYQVLHPFRQDPPMNTSHASSGTNRPHIDTLKEPLRRVGVVTIYLAELPARRHPAHRADSLCRYAAGIHAKRRHARISGSTQHLRSGRQALHPLDRKRRAIRRGRRRSGIRIRVHTAL